MTPERIDNLRGLAESMAGTMSGDALAECLDEIERLSVNQLTDDERKHLLGLVQGERCSTFPANWLQSLCVRLLSGGTIKVD